MRLIIEMGDDSTFWDRELISYRVSMTCSIEFHRERERESNSQTFASRRGDPLDQGALPKTPSELSRGGRTGSAKNWAFKVLRRGRVRFSRAAMFPR